MYYQLVNDKMTILAVFHYFWQENNYSIPIKLIILNNRMEWFSVEASCPFPRTVCNCVSASSPPCMWNSFIICNRGHYSWKALALTSVWQSFALLLPFGPDIHLLETDQHHPLTPPHPFNSSLFPWDLWLRCSVPRSVCCCHKKYLTSVVEAI